MHQVPMPIWNAIAKGQALSKPWSILFNMTPDEVQNGLAELVDAPIRAAGADEQTVLAYRMVAPLLIENSAISAFIAPLQDQSLRNALPEITGVGDALMFASLQYQLTPPQQAKLKKLLINALKT